MEAAWRSRNRDQELERQTGPRDLRPYLCDYAAVIIGFVTPISDRTDKRGEAAMWGYGYNMMGWSWLIGAVILVLVIVGVFVVLRLIPRRTNHPPVAAAPIAIGGPTPRQILDERYAKGDLTTEEYLERVKHLGLA